MTRIGVIIPYFQRQTGLLFNAVMSVLKQSGELSFEIVVVDDQSPRPAREELDPLSVPAPHRLVLLEQVNAGPGAARNRALDHFDQHPVAFVAFLDSDDQWMPDHIQTALAVLGEDADFFFDDHTRVQYSEEQSYFAAHDRLRGWLVKGWIRLLEPDVLECEPDKQLALFLEHHPAQTSTVVFRVTPATAPLRFDQNFRSLGEDLLFWLDLGKASRRTRFSSRLGGCCGAGVSIFHSALSWDHPDAPMRFAYSLLLWSTIERRFALTNSETTLVHGRIKGFRRGFTYIWLRHALRYRFPHRQSLSLLRHHLNWRAWHMLPSAAALAGRYLQRRRLFPEH